ncbi:MAG: carboxypeptidase-like regulatory domain-containing protein [Pyrinomonadaceae bacterium]
MKRASILFSLAALILFVYADAAFACWCAPKRTVLEEYNAANIVVATRLVALERSPTPATLDNGGTFMVEIITSVTMVVTKVYKGPVKVGQELEFEDGFLGDCVMGFGENEVDTEFLFYLRSPTTKDKSVKPGSAKSESKEVYSASACGRSGPLDEAFADLSYLDNMAMLRGKTRFYGTLSSRDRKGFPNADIRVRIGRGKQMYDLKTDSNGFFEIYDLPPGDYGVWLDIPFGWRIDSRYKIEDHVGVSITKGKDTALDLNFTYNTRLRGKILSPTGEPLGDVPIAVVPTTEDRKDEHDQTFSADDGSFEFTELAPGKYYLIANMNQDLSTGHRFINIYFPGVSDIKKAAVITLEQGIPLEEQTFRIAAMADVISVKGRLTYSDGSPAAEQEVDFFPDDVSNYDAEAVMTDKDGFFNLKLLRGVPGYISADLDLDLSSYKNCAEIRGLITQQGSTSLKISSSAIRLTEDSYPSNIELVFPFAYCKPSDK